MLGVRKGTQEELSAGGLEVDDKDKDTTPYYVDARYTNRGTAKVKRWRTFRSRPSSSR